MNDRTRSVRAAVHAPPERVWQLLADVTRMSQWSPEVVEVEWLDGATAPAVGARFRGRNRRRQAWSTTCTLTDVEPQRLLAWRVGKGETTWRFELSPAEEGTVVTETFEIVQEPGPVGRWLTKVGTGLPWSARVDDLEQGARTTLERLRATAEAAP